MISKHGIKQIVNHINGHHFLTTKDNLFLHMRQLYEKDGQDLYSQMPLTFIIDYTADTISD